MNEGESNLPSPGWSALPEGGVLVAGRDGVWRDRVLHELSGREHVIGLAKGGAEALLQLETGTWKTLLLESDLPDLDASEVAELAITKYPQLQVWFIHSYAPGKQAAELGKAEREPACLDTVVLSLPACRWREHPGGDRQICDPPSEALPPALPGMIGSSQPMLRVYELARRIAPRTTTVLITGATGTGKEVVARAIHQLSPRASRPFVVVNCAAIPETLLESELFGYARGAFTGAVQTQAGRFWAANGGTLLLDEVGELPLSMQAKLLRFIELKEIQRLGSAEVSRVDARILAATNHDLERRVAEKQFREDLFYRLAVFSLSLPQLEDRAEDIVPLAQHFLATFARGASADTPLLSQGAIRRLMRHHWPGNVRELQLVIERAYILAEEQREILPEHICFPGLQGNQEVKMEMRGIAV